MEKKEIKFDSLIELVNMIKQGKASNEMLLGIDPKLITVAGSILELGRILENKFLEMKKMLSITQQINSGIHFEEVINYLYDNFYNLIPYDRIGVALLSIDRQKLTTQWSKSRANVIFINKGYSYEMGNSSLLQIIETGQPRILNDLEKYYIEHPSSESTSLILKEGVKSSLTCPLFVSSKPVGFIFFSSFEKNTYKDAHIALFQEIAGHISIIIEKSKLYSEILSQKQKLEELNEIKNRFLGIAAHDLRNPLGVVLSYSEYLVDSLEELTPIELKEVLNDIKTSSKEMLTLVNDLLDISKIESGTIELEKAEIDFIPYITKVIEKNQILAKPKNILIELKVPDKSIFINLDQNKISQVLNNLINNAVKFSLPGKKVTLITEYNPENLVIEVIDEGPGIEENDIQKLFQEFYRGKNKPTAGEKSTSLGLAICKKLIEAHKGSIEIKSKVGVGSNFRITLPIEKN
jgi:signal transduction histidine kinase